MSTYKTFGPRAYTEADANDFKGRDNAIKEVMNLMQTAEMTTIFAMSGDGKSSLIHAGLYPVMRAKEWFPIEIRFGNQEYSQPDFFEYNEAIACTPFEAWVASKISKEAERLHLTSYIANDIILPDVKSDEERDADCLIRHSLWWILRTIEFSREGKDCLPHQFLPILVFDQFEEVINYPSERSWTDAFFKLFQETMSEMPPQRIMDLLDERNNAVANGYSSTLLQTVRRLRFKMLFALRKEFIGALDYWTQQKYYVPALVRNRYCLLPLSEPDANMVAHYRIAASTKYVKNERLAQLIGSAMESEGENKGLVSPLILSILLDELDKLNLKDMEGLKPEEILRKFYERQLREIGFRNRQIRIMENALVDNSGKRRPDLPIDDEKLLGLDFVNRNKAKLDKMDKELHIIRCNSIHGKVHIELVHDRLADVVKIRRNEAKQRHRVLLNLLTGIITFIIISLVSIHFAMHRTEVNTWADQSARLATIEHDGVWSTDDIDRTMGAGRIDEVLWDKGDTINLMDMGYLSKLIIDVENPVFVALSNCPRLREIRFTNKVKSVKGMGYIGQLGENMKIVIGDSLNSLSHDFMDYLGNDTKFVLSPSNPYLKLGYAYDSGGHSFGDKVLKTMLWEKDSKSILFIQGFQGDVLDPDNIVFPDEFAGKELGWGFFNTFKNKEKKTISDQLTYAGRDFETFVTNPYDTLIGSYAFMKCKNMTSITLNNITTISSEAFDECINLKSIDLKNVKHLNGLAFHNCYSLSNVVFPDDSITIGASEFDGCRSLQQIKLPRKLYADCRNTFRRCINLTTVYLPDTLIASDFYSKENELPTMFSYCPNIRHFEISSHSQFKWKEDSVLYYEDMPAFLNLCTNPNWCAKDSSYYFKDGLLYKKDGVLVDACAGSGYCEGCHPQAELFLHFYYKPIIGGTHPYPFYPTDGNTIVEVPQKARGTFAIINPSISIKELHVPYAEPKNVGVDLIETFAELSEITLVVPWHRREAYENDPIFQQYGEIVEESFLTTTWRVVKNDISEFISHAKEINFYHPLIFLKNPVMNWVSCSMLAFLFVYLIRKISKVQTNAPLTDVRLLSICVIVSVFWIPFYFLLYHVFSLHMPCDSYDHCIYKVCISEMMLTLISVVVYLQLIESGILQGAIIRLKNGVIGLYRRL